MSERLFIRLGKTQESACTWLIWSEQEQEIIASGELKDATQLSSLSERAASKLVDVLVPTANVTLTSVTLPEKGQSKAVKALPFMLEEALVTNVDDMHFVTGPRDGDELSVAAVSNEQMTLWLDWLAQANIKPRCLVPDCLALPLEECDWAAMEFGQETLLRTGVAQGQNFSAPWLAFALPQLTSEREEGVSVAAYSDLALSDVELKHQPLEMPMLVLAKGVLQAPMNLLTGAFTPQKEYSKYLRLWRNTAVVFAVAFILALVNKGLNIYQAEAQIASLQQQVQDVYKLVKPGSTLHANLVRKQLDGELRRLQGGGSSAAFFSTLRSLRPAFEQISELKPNSLRFDASRGELRMQVTAKSYAQIEEFKNLIPNTLDVNTGAMNSSDDQVTGTLTVRSK